MSSCNNGTSSGSRTIIRDGDKDLSGDCCDRTNTPTKELHNYHRTLPDRGTSNPGNDVIEDEDGFGFLTGDLGHFIFDNTPA